MTIELFANAASSALTAGINNSVTSLTVTDASTFPATGNFRIVIDTEILKVTAVSGTTLTVVRGQEGTTAATHSSAATVTVILTSAALAAFRSDSVTFDTIANRPSFGVQGRLYIPTDGNGPIDYDTGSAWQPFGLFNFALIAPSTGNFGTSVGAGSDSFTQNGDAIVHSMNGNQNKARVKTLTLGKTYTVQMSPMYTPTTTGIAMAGLIIRDSATGNTRCFGFQTNGGTRSFTVSSFTGASSFAFGANIGTAFANSNFPSTPYFQRINQPSSGNRLFEWSIDGRNWVTLLSEAFNTGVANPDHDGFLL